MAPMARNVINAKALKERLHLSLGQRPRNYRNAFPRAESAIRGIGYRLVCVSTYKVADEDPPATPADKRLRGCQRYL
jgi:hypothetical protein